jgi:tetratricopeptide (TPR) repeat protein
MHRALLTSLLISLVWGAEASQKDPDLLDRWSSAVTTHEPGGADEWAVSVGGWTREQLVTALNDVRRRRVSDSVLRLGAVLHFDIAFHGSPRARGPLFRAYPSREPRVTGAILAVDGRDEGHGTIDTHLEFARALLEELTSDPGAQEFARLWYDAAAARLVGQRNLAELLLHLREARRMFPSDPEILFASGCLNETFAAPRTQAIARAERAGTIVPIIGSKERNLADAERFYRRVLALQAGFAEARLRLGRVLGLQGKHEEAVGELERAVEDAEDSTESYYALLFLGREEEMLGRLDSAQRRFERAATLFPSAQAPQISLSRLARERGDDRAAQESLIGVLTRSASDDGDDPWWTYDTSLARHAERKVARMYRVGAQEIR